MFKFFICNRNVLPILYKIQLSTNYTQIHCFFHTVYHVAHRKGNNSYKKGLKYKIHTILELCKKLVLLQG
jgi:hypothetical protein